LHRFTFHPWIRVVFGWGIAGVCVILTLRNVDLQRMWQILIRVNPGLLLIISLMNLATYLATALRWQLLFTSAEAPRLHSLFKALMIAQLANTGLPGRLGMISRIYVVSRSGAASAFFVLCTLLIEKVLEGVSLVPFAMVVLFLLTLPEWASHSIRLASGVALVACVGVVGFFAAGRLARGSRILGRLDRFTTFKRFWQAFSTVQAALRPECWPRLWGWSLLIWFAIIGMNYLALLALDIEVPFIATVALLVVLQFGGRIPAPLAGIGVYHYLAIVTLSLFAVGNEAALSFGVLTHAVTYLPPSLLGAWYIWRGEGMQLATLTRESLSLFSTVMGVKGSLEFRRDHDISAMNRCDPL